MSEETLFHETLAQPPAAARPGKPRQGQRSRLGARYRED
jgi:hypothetical protein